MVTMEICPRYFITTLPAEVIDDYQIFHVRLLQCAVEERALEGITVSFRQFVFRE
jgi:hypothetical protein